MKLNETIILTLADFRRYFSMQKFWPQRHEFLRDMSPKDVYYCNPGDKEKFREIAKWIEAEDHDNTSLRSKGLGALSQFAKCNVTEKELKAAMGLLDFSASVIKAPRNGMLNLQGAAMSDTEAMAFAHSHGVRERLHKIEIEHNEEFDDEEETKSSVFINGNEVFTLRNNECVYITEVKGLFLRVLPNKLSKGNRILTIENITGEFRSRMTEEIYLMGLQTCKHDEVTQIGFNGLKPIWSGDEYFVLGEQTTDF